MTPRRPPLRYHGGKWMLAPWIISHFPPHRIYVEPFGGSASVLLRKSRVFGEIYNDADGEIVNVFRMLRERGDELAQAVALTPFARAEFDASREPTDDPLERARRTVARSFFGRASASIVERTGFRAKSWGSHRSAPMDWVNLPPALGLVVERLQGVVIENKPAIEVMLEQDSPETLHYCDPPYPLGTRSARVERSYRVEMSDDDHRELAQVLRRLEGLVVLSGYGCELYDEELYPAWSRVERETFADGAVKRTEVLWLSPRCADAQQQMELAI
jgi:DNA adenine methylase